MSIEEVLEVVGGRVILGDPGRSRCIRGVAGYEDAGPGDLTFAIDDRHLARALESEARAVLVSLDCDREAMVDGTGVGEDKLLIGVETPRLAFARALELFAPRQSYEPGIAPTAVVLSGAQVARDATVCDGAVVEDGAEIEGCVLIGAGSYIGAGVRVGKGTRIHPRVTVLRDTEIGKNCVIHPGAVIGGEGFGYVQRPDGSHKKIPQIGRVVIGDQVEIGCGVTVDRATTGETRIGRGTKVDNLVHIGHNCRIGEDVLLVAMVGLSGGVEVGNRTIMAGKASAVEHLTIGPGSVIMGASVVARNVPAGSRVSGNPARPHREEMKIKAACRKVPGLLARVRHLEKRLAGLERGAETAGGDTERGSEEGGKRKSLGRGENSSHGTRKGE